MGKVGYLVGDQPPKSGRPTIPRNRGCLVTLVERPMMSKNEVFFIHAEDYSWAISKMLKGFAKRQIFKKIENGNCL